MQEVTDFTGIQITRKAAPWRDRFRAYRIVLDGLQVGEIRNGQTVDFPVSPGRHELHLKIDWAGSKVLTFEVSADEIVRFRCEPEATSFSAAPNVISSFRRSG